jgi:predicted enzyme related to lactoylglutathione lyase
MADGEQPRTYPRGVPCWVDTEQPDTHAAARFYGALFGWAFEDVMPAAAPGTYLVATLGGRDVAAIGQADGTPAWATYIAVDDADATAAAVAAAGGTVIGEPWEAGPGGRAGGSALRS